jgi:hypothetical protein
MDYPQPYEWNIFQEQMPQQMIIAAMNNAAAATKPTFTPKRGTTSRPTSGRVHIQMTMASAISSKWWEIRFNTEVFQENKFHPILQLWLWRLKRRLPYSWVGILAYMNHQALELTRA